MALVKLTGDAEIAPLLGWERGADGQPLRGQARHKLVSERGA